MRRRLGFTVLLGALVLGLASPASAVVTDVDVAPTGEILDGSVQISGTIECTKGRTFTIEVTVTQANKLNQPTYKGSGSDTGICRGSQPATWTVITDQNTGTPKPGQATVCYTATDKGTSLSGCEQVILET